MLADPEFVSVSIVKIPDAFQVSTRSKDQDGYSIAVKPTAMDALEMAAIRFFEVQNGGQLADF